MAKCWKERNDVGKRFVKGEDVAIGRLTEPAMKSVKQRMRRLVSDDVMRDSGKHDPARKHIARISIRCAEVTEHQGLSLRTIKGIL
jgi:hypothetical protein